MQVLIKGQDYRDLFSFNNNAVIVIEREGFVPPFTLKCGGKDIPLTPEKFFFVYVGLDFLLRKIFAQKPPTLPYPAYVAKQLAFYASSKGKILTEDWVPFMSRPLEKLPALADFFCSPGLSFEQISSNLKAGAFSAYAESQRPAGTAPEDFSVKWKSVYQRASRALADRKAKEELSELILSKGYLTLPLGELKEFLLAPDNYSYLSDIAKRSVLPALGALYQEASRADEESLYRLMQGRLSAYASVMEEWKGWVTIDIFRLFTIESPVLRKDFIRKIVENLESNKRLPLFYIEYPAHRLKDEWSAILENLLNLLISGLNEQYAQSRDTVIDLWDNPSFRLLWLLAVLWFRKEFAKLKSLEV